MTPEAGKVSTESAVICLSPEINTLAVVSITIWVGAAEQSVSSQGTDPSLTSFIGHIHKSAKINTVAVFLLKSEYRFSSTNWLMRN